jgi:hypothetical protein
MLPLHTIKPRSTFRYLDIIIYVGKEDYYCSSYLLGKSQGYLETWQDDFRIYIGAIYMTNSVGAYPIKVYPVICIHALGDRTTIFNNLEDMDHTAFTLGVGSWGIHLANRKQRKCRPREVHPKLVQLKHWTSLISLFSQIQIFAIHQKLTTFEISI